MSEVQGGIRSERHRWWHRFRLGVKCMECGRHGFHTYWFCRCGYRVCFSCALWCAEAFKKNDRQHNVLEKELADV